MPPIPIPIVLTAFGTTTRAMATYRFIQRQVQQRFAHHEIRWAYTSRRVRDTLAQDHRIILKHPHEVLFELGEQGHAWAVVQSTHLVCGHEFHRLLTWSRQSSVRTAIGLPLLTDPQDFQSVADCLAVEAAAALGHAVVLVGHGTDHPSWMAYPVLEQLLRRRLGPGVFVGTLENGPDAHRIAAAAAEAGFGKVRLIPLLLVAGRHVIGDLMGDDDDSWKRIIADHGLQVTVKSEGLGVNPAIVDLFCEHIASALDAIPRSAGPEFRT